MNVGRTLNQRIGLEAYPVSVYHFFVVRVKEIMLTLRNLPLAENPVTCYHPTALEPHISRGASYFSGFHGSRCPVGQ